MYTYTQSRLTSDLQCRFLVSRTVRTYNEFSMYMYYALLVCFFCLVICVFVLKDVNYILCILESMLGG